MKRVTVMALCITHSSYTSGILEEALGTPGEIIEKFHSYMGTA